MKSDIPTAAPDMGAVVAAGTKLVGQDCGLNSSFVPSETGRMAVANRPWMSPTDCTSTRMAASLRLHALLNAEPFKEMEVEYEASERVLWCYFAFNGRPSFRAPVISDIQRIYESIRSSFDLGPERDAPVRYVVWGSRTPGVWNLGGDLDLFVGLIRNKDRVALSNYAMSVVDMAYNNYVSLDLPIVTIALVQGNALGGGFEGVLSNNIIVAEKGARFGLPEVLFNLFPGMGAYSFLARRIAPGLAERMILSGRIYGSEELYQMGVIDHLVETGKGHEAVQSLLADRASTHAVHRAVLRARNAVSPVRYEELVEITRIWVDTAMNLEEADLRKMMRLVSAQERLRGRSVSKPRMAAL